MSKSKQFALNKLYIDLQAIAHNYQTIQKFAGNKVECTANIKSNAYGLGVLPIMRCLSMSGCNKFFVTTLDEALELRHSLSITDEIYVLNGVALGEEAEFAQNHIMPVLNTKAQYEIFNNYCRKKNRNFYALLNIDTGVNRFGLSIAEAMEIAAQDASIRKIKIHFIISQLAYGSILDKQQLALMHQLKTAFQVPISFADSNSLCLGSDYHFDIMRLGIILYGCAPEELNLKKAVSLTSSIIQIRELTEDCFIGHNNGYKIAKNTIIATIPIGYADGLHRTLSNKAICYINGHPVPVIGDISMDLTVIDVTNIPKEDLVLGAEVELLGKNASIETMAQQADTTRHDILVSLSSRLHRIYQ